MPTTPEISIIIPTYNREQMVCRAIRGVLRQATMPIEILVVDDGSTDNTHAAVKALDDDRIRYFYQPNSGRSVARNHGLDAAMGEYVLFLDSDDALLPDALATLAEILIEDSSIDLIAGGWCVASEDLHDFHVVHPSASTCADLSAWILDCLFPIHTAMTRRSTIGDARFDQRAEPAEDWGFWLELARRGARMRLTETLVALYVFHGFNSLLDYPITSRSAVYMLEQFFSLPDLPGNIRSMKNTALARVHLARGIRFLDQDKHPSAIRELESAMQLRPEWLNTEWNDLITLCTGITGSRQGIFHRSDVLFTLVATAISQTTTGINHGSAALVSRMQHTACKQRFWQHYHQGSRSSAFRSLLVMLRLDFTQLFRPRIWRALAHLMVSSHSRMQADAFEISLAKMQAAECLAA